MIKVVYSVTSTTYGVKKKLKELEEFSLLSFDTETRGIYSKPQVKQAQRIVDGKEVYENIDMKLVSLVARNSGLSYPSLIKTTHFIFGISVSSSAILIANNFRDELVIWNWLAKYKGKLLIHNAMFDLRIMYQRVKQFPKDYEDTQLLAKSLINNAENWKAKVGLKELMGSEYSPKWSLYTDYDVEDLKNRNFLEYCAIDSSACYNLWIGLQKYIEENKK